MNRLKKKIKDAGFKFTKPRLLILKALQKNKELISAQDIFEKVNKKVDLASVYRNLNAFKEIGIVFEEKIKGESFYYISEKAHHHVICEKCGYTECHPCEHKFSSIKNFRDLKHQLIMTGVCSKCI